MKQFVLLFLFFVTFCVNAQSNFSSGWLPKATISTKISDNFKWVNSLEARESLYNQKLEFKHTLIDASSVISYKFNGNKSLNGGYVIRFSEKNTAHRLLLHYNYIKGFENFKLANRLGFESFFTRKHQPKFRVRYRATFQKALQGQRIDPKEFYTKIANEYLYQITKEDLEIRFVPYLGYQLSKTEKLEFGIEYRASKFINTTTSSKLWLRTSWYIVL